MSVVDVNLECLDLFTVAYVCWLKKQDKYMLPTV